MKIIMITRKTDVNAIIFLLFPENENNDNLIKIARACPLEEDGRAENWFLHLWVGGKKMIKYQVIVKGILDEFHLTIHNNIL